MHIAAVFPPLGHISAQGHHHVNGSLVTITIIRDARPEGLFGYFEKHGIRVTNPYGRELADSVLEVSIRANRQVVEGLRGGDKMCKALLEIMEPEIDKIIGEIRADDAHNSIIRAVKSFRDLGVDDERIKGLLVKNYELSPNDAATYL